MYPRKEPVESKGIASIQSYVKHGWCLLWQNRSSCKLHYQTTLTHVQKVVISSLFNQAIPLITFTRESVSKIRSETHAFLVNILSHQRMPIVEIWGLVLVFAVVKVPLVARLMIHMLSLNSLMVRFDMQKYFASSRILRDRCFPMLAGQTSSHHLDQIYPRGSSFTTKGVRILVSGTFI